MIKYKMDELTRYLKSSDYDESELEEILNKKIIITKDHIDIINVRYCYGDCELNMIKLFTKYGFIFTEDIYISLVNKNGYILYNIPKNDKTNKICKIAVQQNGGALPHVPHDKKTDEICKIAVQYNGYILQYVPDDKKTDEICKIAVRQNGDALQFVPDDKITDEICEIAVKQNKEALKYVPHDKKTFIYKK